MKSKNMCSGCYNNDYNHGLGGSKECWSYESAKVEKKIEISVDMPPPYDKDRARPVLSCFRKQRYVQVKPENLTHDGYWK